METYQDFNKYDQFGGWLTVILLGHVFSIIYNLSLFINGMQRIGFQAMILDPLNALTVFQIIILSSVSIRFIVVMRKRSQEALNQLRSLLIVIVIVKLAAILLTGFVVSQVPNLDMQQIELFDILAAFTPLVIWMPYFNRSKRVARYYNPPVQSKDIIDVEIIEK